MNLASTLKTNDQIKEGIGLLLSDENEIKNTVGDNLLKDSRYIDDMICRFMVEVGYEIQRTDRHENDGNDGIVGFITYKKRIVGEDQLNAQSLRKVDEDGKFKNRMRNAMHEKNVTKRQERYTNKKKEKEAIGSDFLTGMTERKIDEQKGVFVNDYINVDPLSAAKLWNEFETILMKEVGDKTISRYDKFINKHMPIHIDELEQKDVDAPYIKSVNTIKKGMNKTEYDIDKTFLAMGIDEPPYVKRTVKDLLRRIERQNNIIMKGYQSPMEIIYIAVNMVKDGRFRKKTRKMIAIVVLAFIKMIKRQNDLKDADKLIKMKQSAWTKTYGRKNMYVVRIDSNFHLKLCLLAQAMFAIISVDDDETQEILQNIMCDVIVFQVCRGNYADDVKNLTNVVSLYMGKDGKPTGIHSHPVYSWTIEELRRSDGMTWRQPEECTGGCKGGLFVEASKLRSEMFENVIKKAHDTLPDLFDDKLFPNLTANLSKIMQLQYNENALLISRTFIMMNVSLYVNSPGAEGLMKELNSVVEFKKESDVFRLENPELFKKYEEDKEIIYEDLINKSRMNTKITPFDVANNLEAYTTTKSGALPRIKLNMTISTPSGKNQIQASTGAKVSYLAFMKDTTNISLKYVYTENRAEYLKRKQKDKDAEWRYNSIGSRLDVGRQRRHIYNESLPLYQLENIATEPVLNGFTGYKDDTQEGAFSRTPRPEGILTNTQKAQNTMIALYAQIPFDKEHIIFSTDASYFDKASRGLEHHVLFYSTLLKVYKKYNGLAEWMNILPVTVDNKPVGFIGIVEILINLFSGKQTYMLKDEWSSAAVDMDYTPSGSKITFAQNSFSNLVVQEYLRVIYNEEIGKNGVGTQMYKDYSGVAGDDAATVMSVENGCIITPEMLYLYIEVIKKLSLLSGYEMSPFKGGICTTEVAKIFTTLGYVIQHKPTTIASEKESTAENTSSRVSRVSVIVTLTSERNRSSKDTILFCRALGIQRLNYMNYDGNYSEVIQMGCLVSTLPPSMGGSGMPIFTFMNEQWTFIGKVLGQNAILQYLLGVASNFKETKVAEKRRSIEKSFLSVAKGKGMSELKATNSDKTLGIHESNLKGFFAPNEERLKNAMYAKSKIGRNIHAIRELDNVSYDKSQERKIKELASTIALGIEQEPQLFIKSKYITYDQIMETGKYALINLYKDDPVFNAMKIVNIQFGKWENNYQICYPSQHNLVRKIVAHYGINTDKPVSYDYLHKIRIIIARYATRKPAMSPPSDIMFITTLLNSGIGKTLDDILDYMSAVFGVSAESIDQTDATTILRFISTPSTFAHMAEASTVAVYISNRLLETIQIITASLTSTKNYVRMLKTCAINIMMFYERPIISLKIAMDHEFREQTRFFQDRFIGWDLFTSEPQV